MIAQAFDLVDSLGANIFLECGVAGNHVAAETEFLPNQDAKFIADVVEVVMLVKAATPFTYQVHVGIAGGFKNHAVLRRRFPRREAIEGNDVHPFGEYRNAIDDESETLAPLIGITPQFYGAQAGFHLYMGSRFFPDANNCGKAIPILRAVANRVPKLGRGDTDRERDMIHARVKGNALATIVGGRSR